MKRQNVIIMIYPDKEPICRGNLKKLCEEFELYLEAIMCCTWEDFQQY